MSAEPEEEGPFGYTALIEHEEGHPSTCGLDYMGRTPDQSHVYKVSVSTRLLEGQYVVLAMQVSALHITDTEAMTGDWAKVEHAQLAANDLSTEKLERPGGEDVDDYIAVSTDPGDLMIFPVDMLKGADLQLGIAGQPALNLRMPVVGKKVKGEVFDCFDAMKTFVNSVAQTKPENGE